jgi:hypothetical protein
LNPWKDKAENQAFYSLAEGARRIGHTLVHLSNSDDILSAAPDFVIAVASTQPKLTEIPTFAAIHEPRVRFWEQPAYFQNLLTYDGYLTISHSLEAFLRSFCAGYGKRVGIGRYYNTPQKQTLSADVEGLLASGALRLCYFGTNWDPRSRPLFRALARKDYVRIYGPASAWSYLGNEAYCGATPFDGISVQRTYAAFGAGLVVLSQGHMVDDVISNRIFEIASVGAVPICPDLPWLKSTFGDCLYYYDPRGTVATMVAEIDAALSEVRADPKGAAARARQARTVFEARFSAEVMIGEAVRYFETWRETAGRPTDPAGDPLIDVVVRVGGRPVETVRRALDSLEAQFAGRFRVVFVRYKDLDLSALTDHPWRRIEGFEIVDVPGGKRAATMCAGLKAVRSPLFAILDDDDFVLPEHFRAMLDILPQAREGRAFIYSGFMNVEEGPAPTADDGGEPRERRAIANLSPAYGDLKTITGLFAPNGFLASSALIREMQLEDWSMATAEDTLVVASLAALGDPHFCYRATAAHVVGSIGASEFQNSASRMQDLMDVYLRLGPLIDQLERKMAPPQMRNWDRLGQALTRALEQKSRETAHRADLLVLEEGVPTTSLHERDDVIAQRVNIVPSDCVLYGESRVEPIEDHPGLRVSPPSLPWAFGSAIRLDGLLKSGPQWIVVEAKAHPEPIGVGVLNKKGDDFAVRVELPASQVDTEMWLRIAGPEDISSIMIQNWANPITAPFLVKGAWVVQEIAIGNGSAP